MLQSLCAFVNSDMHFKIGSAIWGSAAVFQAVDVGSIPITRSNHSISSSVVATAIFPKRPEGGRHVIKVLGKGDRERLIPIQPSLARRLRRFADRPRQDSTSDKLFLTLRRGRDTGQVGPLKESAVEQMIRNLAVVAGIEKRVYPHLLRHSFATDCLRRGGNPILLQQILGHSSLAMITQTYQHLTFSDAHDELMRLLAAESPR